MKLKRVLEEDDLLEGIEGTANIGLVYNFLNNKYFEKSLPKIPVTWATFTGALGKAYVKYKKIAGGIISEIDRNSLKIEISKKFEHDLRSVQAVLLHEMVHIALFIRNIIGNHHSSSEFKGWISKLRKKSGLEIPYVESDATYSSKIPAKTGLILVVEKPGWNGYSIYAEKFLEKKGDEFIGMLCRVVSHSEITLAEIYHITHTIVGRKKGNRRVTGITYEKLDDQEVEDVRKKGIKMAEVNKAGGWYKGLAGKKYFDSDGRER